MSSQNRIPLRDLLAEVVMIHADPANPDYNECDVSPCAWCESARVYIDEMRPGCVDESDDDPDFFCDDDDLGCQHCNDGVLLVCIDDLCQGQGWCMHGDGEIVCPYCGGQG